MSESTEREGWRKAAPSQKTSRKQPADDGEAVAAVRLDDETLEPEEGAGFLPKASESPVKSRRPTLQISTSTGISEVLEIEWASLIPLEHEPLKTCGNGYFVQAIWRKGAKSSRKELRVMVKIFKSDWAGSAEKLEQKLLLEAGLMKLAADDSESERVAKLFGVSSGEVNEQWKAKLGEHASEALYDSSRKMLALIIKHESGGTLADVLRNTWTADIRHRLKLLHDIAQGLFDLHNNTEKVIVHGDVRAENILITEDGRALLCDFGLAGSRDFVDGEILDTPMASPQKMPFPDASVGMALSFTSSSRRKDVHDFGTLCFEVLTGEESQIGTPLDMEKLPIDTPPAIVELIVCCHSETRNYSIEQARDALKQADEDADRDTNKIFFSYAWGANDCRKPLADAIHKCLVSAGHTVWRDVKDMKKNPNLTDCIIEGLTSCPIVVVLLSPDYVKSSMCLFELENAHRLQKPIAVCIVEPSSWREWKNADGSPVIEADSEIIELAQLKTRLYADCGDASALDWSSGLTVEQKRF